MERTSYSLKELCKVAEVTGRTVRYYIAEGLLPPPSGTGPFSRYGYEHLLRLKFIKRLQEEYLPLREIKNLLAGKTITELENIARRNGLVSGTPTAGPGDNQDDYLERLLQPGQDKALRFLRDEIAASGPIGISEAPADYTLDTVAFGGAGAIRASNEAMSVTGGAEKTAIQAESATDEGENEDLALAEFSDTATSENTGSFFSAPGHGYQPPMPPPPPTGMAFQPKMTLSGPVPVSPASLSSAPSNFLRKRMASRSAEQTTSFSAQPVPPPASVPQAEAEQKPEQEQPIGQSWERIIVAPGIELHIESNIANQHRPALSLLLREIKNLLGQ